MILRPFCGHDGENDKEFALFQITSLLFHFNQFLLTYWRIFLELNSKGLYLRSEKDKHNQRCLVFTSRSLKHEIRKLHVVVLQRRQKKTKNKKQKSVMHVQSCFAQLNPLFYNLLLPGLSRRLAPVIKCRRFLSYFQRYVVRDISLARYFGSLIEILSAILKSTKHGGQSRERL